MSRQADRAAKRRLAREEMRVRKIVESELSDLDAERQKALIDKIVLRDTTSPIQYESEGMAVEVKRYAEHIAKALDAEGYDTVVLSNAKPIGPLMPIKANILEGSDPDAAAEAISGAEEVWSDGRITAHEYRQDGILRYAMRKRDEMITISDLIGLRNQLAEDHDIILQISADYDDGSGVMVNMFPRQEPTCGHGREGACPHCIGQ